MKKSHKIRIIDCIIHPSTKQPVKDGCSVDVQFSYENLHHSLQRNDALITKDGKTLFVLDTMHVGVVKTAFATNINTLSVPNYKSIEKGDELLFFKPEKQPQTTKKLEILQLTLKKKWFDMIASGKKKEEYREIKEYWISRLCWRKPDMIGELSVLKNEFKQFDFVAFKNGYSKDAPEMIVEVRGIQMKEGNTDWGAEKGVMYFSIHLGEIISLKNYKPQ